MDYEDKLGGYRAIGVKTGRGRRRVLPQRQGTSTSDTHTSQKRWLELPSETVVDGEIVALDDTGRPDFHRFHDKAALVTYRQDYFNFAYSALAAMKTGMSGSASFQSVRKP
jgi:ATP-dependent DNA ligase